MKTTNQRLLLLQSNISTSGLSGLQNSLMKKIIILTLVLSLKLYSQETPVITEIPYYSSTEADMVLKGYSDTPQNTVNVDSYKPTYSNRTRDYLRNLNKSQEIKQEPTTGTLEKIIKEDRKKIDISGGYVKANNDYITKDDGTLQPKNDLYKSGVNNDEYNIAIEEQKRKQDFKNVKNNLEDLLPLVLMLVLIIAVIYLIIFLRKKIKTNAL